jgi:hypothetical protein
VASKLLRNWSNREVRICARRAQSKTGPAGTCFQLAPRRGLTRIAAGRFSALQAACGVQIASQLVEPGGSHLRSQSPIKNRPRWDLFSIGAPERIDSNRRGAILGPSGRLRRPNCFAIGRTGRFASALAEPRWDLFSIGAPERIRTSDPQIRNLVLYPAELPGRFARF